MKILAISDRPPKQCIKKTLEENSIDLIITLGDLDRSTLSELEDIKIPKIGVYGNHCSGNYFKGLGIKDMHLQTFKMNGITFGGFQGCVRYKSDPTAIMYAQEEALELIKVLPKVDVLLCHCPPYGVNDEIGNISHEGFLATAVYIDEKKPKFLLHGHTYPKEDALVTKKFETNIIYVYQDKIIDLIF